MEPVSKAKARNSRVKLVRVEIRVKNPRDAKLMNSGMASKTRWISKPFDTKPGSIVKKRKIVPPYKVDRETVLNN